MVFSSIFFIFVFLPILILAYYIFPKKIKNIILLIGSLVFYAWGEPLYICIMVLSIIFNYYMAIIIDKIDMESKKRKFVFVLSAILNLFLLGIFKYYGFFIDNINNIFSTNIEYKALALPIGISFYTFQILSYVIDVYLKKVEVQKNILNFALYISMFPQLVAGPILKYLDIKEQLDNRVESLDGFGYGVERFIQGLAKKVLLANNIGILWTTISTINLDEISVLTSWLGIIAFTLQIYFDFSGYSDMAIGIGKMFGFDFIENFNYPYISTSITEFWRRWHISLSSWFKEYVYIPLGGNRCGIKRQIINIGVVWLLTGFWHGASWNFVVWGLYYGVILFIEKVFLKTYLDKLPKLIKHIYTMIIVIVGWVFFSIDNLSIALKYISIMFGVGDSKIYDSTFLYLLSTNIILLIILILASTPILKKIYIKIRDGYKGRFAVIAMLVQVAMLIMCIAYLVSSTYNPFLYFRF